MTRHRLHCADARELRLLEDSSVQLVVTSPPYPMIAMWDELFARLDPVAAEDLAAGRGRMAHERMHRLLDTVWDELLRVLAPGGFLCLNIGDAVRTVGGRFQLYANHARILSRCLAIGFESLPPIIWRKPTNTPTKFMGSGMLPAGAYVTLEHEHILILRKPGRRGFAGEEARMQRRRSALFWEERNAWYSDLWELPGSRQDPGGQAAPGRRSGAFPFEIAYRLICMYSVAGDLVLDPFLGTGTTSVAAATGGRDSVGFDLDEERLVAARERLLRDGRGLNCYLEARLTDHREFVARRGPGAPSEGVRTLEFRHHNSRYGFPVMTAQERDLVLPLIVRVEADGDGGVVVYYEE